MKCTGNSRRNSRRYSRARRRRRRLIRRMIFFLILLCAFAAGIVFFKTSSKEEYFVYEYEKEHYNQAYYKDTLFASDLCVAPEDITPEGGPDTSALKAAGLFDINQAQTDYAYGLHEKVYPASITKIMTALVAIKNADLSETVTVSSNADSGKFAADEQTCGIKAGDNLTLKDLLYGLLLYSGNDNAVAIAEHVGGSIEEFANLMNAQAEELMAVNTHFVNPNGLHDENHYTTAYDLYLIFNECIKHEEFVEMIQASSYQADVTGADGSTRQITWEPTSYYALGDAKLPENATIIGGKTGTTLKAGNCLILLEESKEGEPFISIVMGANTKELLYQNMTVLINGIPDNG